MPREIGSLRWRQDPPDRSHNGVSARNRAARRRANLMRSADTGQTALTAIFQGTHPGGPVFVAERLQVATHNLRRHLFLTCLHAKVNRVQRPGIQSPGWIPVGRRRLQAHQASRVFDVEEHRAERAPFRGGSRHTGKRAARREANDAIVAVGIASLNRNQFFNVGIARFLAHIDIRYPPAVFAGGPGRSPCPLS